MKINKNYNKESNITKICNFNILSESQLSRLEKIISLEALNYEYLIGGDSKEKGSTNCYKVKKSGESNIYNKEIMEIFVNLVLPAALNTINTNTSLEIDRLQIHWYKKGDFIERHYDTAKYSRYKYTCIFFPDDSKKYDGGELICFDKNENNQEEEYIYKLNKNNMLIIDSRSEHQVNIIKSGERRVIVFFLQESN